MGRGQTGMHACMHIHTLVYDCENPRIPKSKNPKIPKISKSKNPKMKNPKKIQDSVDAKRFGFLDVWIFGFLDYGSQATLEVDNKNPELWGVAAS